MENHHFALSQTLAQTNGFLVLFKECPSISKSSPPFYQNGGIPQFSMPEPKSALLGPECDFRVPCVKPFINVRFWEVFWRPKTGKVHFTQKVRNSAPKPEFYQKAVLGAKMIIFVKRLQKSRNASIFALKSSVSGEVENPDLGEGENR